MATTSGGTVFLAVCISLTVTTLEAVERGFVYCPAYPCNCESKDGALIINCRNLYLSALPKFLSFDGRIKELSLRHNIIQNLPANGFRGLHIEKMDLLDNAVTSIDKDAFTGLENSLKALSIQLYAYNGLPTSSLSRLRRLNSLVITGCKQMELRPELFLKLTKLEELHLVGCRVSQIKAGAFRPLTRLKTLVLSQNSLRHQHIAEINRVGSLIHLDLSFNKIQLLDNMAFSRLFKLQDLKLAFNNMAYVAKKAFYNLDFTLDALDLHGNHLREQALESLQYLKILRVLNLRANNISSLVNEYFTSMRYLASLDIGQNEIYLIERRSFLGLGMSLRELDLHGNPLEIIESGAFSDFSVLERLNINSTNLRETLCDDTFKGMTSPLSVLDASKSNLVSNDIKAFSGLLNLTYLDLSKNHIMDIEFTLLRGWNKLQFVNFSHNNITKFPRGNVSLLSSPLTQLDLSWNNIHTIAECAFFVFRKLIDIRLEGNPLDCVCNMLWMHRWLRITHSNYNPGVYRWTCKSPSYLENKPFPDLDYSDFRCSASTARDDKCLDMYAVEEVGEERTTMVQMLHVEHEMTCSPVCLDISIPRPGFVLVHWQIEANQRFVGYNVILKRNNDSVELQSTTVPALVSNYTFPIASDMEQTICVEALSKDLIPVLAKCRVVGATDQSYDGSRERKLHSLIHNSFLPLLFIYICGSLALAFIIACVVICIRRRRKKPRRIKPFYLAYPAWLDHRSSVSSAPLTHDPHFLNTLFVDDLNRSRSNFHSQSTFAERLNGQYPETSIPRDSPSVTSSHRESRSTPPNRVCSMSCSTLNSPPPHHLAMEILAGRAEVDDEFFFHF